MSIPGVTRVFIPEYIVVHLGEPDEEAENIRNGTGQGDMILI